MSSGTTEFLDWTGPVEKDTTVTTSGARWNNTSPVGEVKKTTVSFTVPPFEYDGVSRSFPYIIVQFNYSAPQPFSLVDYNSVVNQTALFNALAFFSIRYRVGTKAYRWALSATNINGDYSRIFAPLYTGQLIKPQFVIECWSTIQFNPRPIALTVPITFNTSILTNPSACIDGGILIPNITTPQPFTDLGLTYPVPLPMQFDPGGAFNSN